MHRIAKLMSERPCLVIPYLLRTSRFYTTRVEDASGTGAARNFATQAAAEPFLNGSSSTYVEEMYLAWQRDPTSVHVVQLVLFTTSFCGVLKKIHHSIVKKRSIYTTLHPLAS